MTPAQLTAILYDISLVISGDTDPHRLATRFVQRLLFHTGFSCGAFACRMDDSAWPEVAASIGNRELRALHGQSVAAWPEALIAPGGALLLDTDAPAQLMLSGARYRTVLRLPAGEGGLILLMSRCAPAAGVDLTQVLTPVLDNFGRVYRLCRRAAEHTRSLHRRVEEGERDLADAHHALKLTTEQKALLEAMVEARTAELRLSRLEIVQRLVRAAELRDSETGLHILRMSHMSALLARAAGWSAERVEMMLDAAAMHDVGKIGVPDAILLKPGRLTPEERAVMEKHAEIGAQILAGSHSELLHLAREIALTHHEKWDGTGYPHRLAGEAIPASGRIAAIVDVFDALTSERPYKEAWPVEQACALLRDQAGQHFDPALVERFLENLPAMVDIRDRFREPARLTSTAPPRARSAAPRPATFPPS